APLLAVTQDVLDVGQGRCLGRSVVVEPPVHEDLEEGLHFGAVAGDVLHVAGDIGAQGAGCSVLPLHAFVHEPPDTPDDHAYDLLHQVLLTGEVVGDQPGAAQPGPLRNAG